MTDVTFMTDVTLMLLMTITLTSVVVYVMYIFLRIPDSSMSKREEKKSSSKFFGALDKKFDS
jgi:biopolymer transport protein ExbD